MSQIETFSYDDEIVRKFLLATIVWGVVGLLLRVIIATQLVFWETNLGHWFSFGRLRPLHTNAVIFAFVCNGMFAGIYHSMRRLCKARMFSDALSNINFLGWQLIIVAAAVTLTLGITVSKEYAELEWPNDAPALRQADVGAAVHNSREISLDAADVLLTRSELKGISELVRLSQISHRTILQNLSLSLGYNTLTIPLAMMGWINPLRKPRPWQEVPSLSSSISCGRKDNTLPDPVF